MNNKWKQIGGLSKGGVAHNAEGNVVVGAYTPRYAQMPPKFSPKKALRSFHDLEVYQCTLECSVLVGKNITPVLLELKFPLLEGITNCSLSIPLYIAEAHSLRFSDFKMAIATLEKAMTGCNKMIVYLEQSFGLYGKKLEESLIQDLSLRYINVRGKMLRLERSWQKYRSSE